MHEAGRPGAVRSSRREKPPRSARGACSAVGTGAETIAILRHDGVPRQVKPRGASESNAVC